MRTILFRTFRRGTAAVAALVLLFGGLPTARADNNLRLELAELAKSVQRQLAGDNVTRIALGAFTGPDDRFLSNAGPGIVLILHEELTKLGLTVRPDAPLILRGTYEDVLDSKTKRLLIALATRLEDRAGKTIAVMEKRGVAGDAAIAAIAGVTGTLPLEPAGSKGRDDALANDIDNPKATFSGTRVLAGKDSPYGVEVLVKQGDDYKARPPRDDKGYAYVPIKRDEVYALRLYNDSTNEAAVTLTIDGVNAFSFCEIQDPKTQQPSFSTFILPPHGSGVVLGWLINLKRSDEFLVTDYAHGAAAELKAAGANVGVVTAVFAACWQGDDRPADEPVAGKSGDATGRGAPITTTTATKVLERKFGVPRAVVSVRYTK